MAKENEIVTLYKDLQNYVRQKSGSPDTMCGVCL